MRHPVLVALALAPLGAIVPAGCGERGPSTATLRTTAPLDASLDLVFVVDNSGSMELAQQALGAAFPAFLAALQRSRGDLPDLHLGVLSSNAGSAGQAGVGGCSGLGDDGALLLGPPGGTCAAQFGLQGSFISDAVQADGTRLPNHTPGQLAPLFGCMAALGRFGCGFEMHLESLHRGLQPGRNPGFLRDDAWLAVVVLADEDDCSTEDGTLFGDPTAGLTSPLGPRTSFRCHEFGVVCDDDPDPRAFGPKAGCRPRPDSPYLYEVDRYVAFLKGLKADPRRVLAAGIVGDFDPASGALTVGPDPNDATLPRVQPSCHTLDPTDPEDGAAPAVRLRAFLDAFPGRHAATSICQADLGEGLARIGALFGAALGQPCLDAPLADGDPASDGLQPSCTVTEVAGAIGGPSPRIIPQCASALQSGGGCVAGGAGIPCWCADPAAAHCTPRPGAPAGQAILVERGGVAPPRGAALQVECLVERR